MKTSQMKIGVVGFGYWGKIITRNLRELGYTDITICEKDDIDWHEIGTKHTHAKDYRELQCDKVFVVVPVASHYEVCKHFLERGIDVFCEKPLDTNLASCQKLYFMADQNNCKLFVDWIFTYNPAVNKIKCLIKSMGKPKSIIANRMNFGPVRSDVDARWDLASHDVSIACHILDEFPLESKWLNFSRNKDSEQNDSTVGILSFSETSVQINASWSYGIKNRMYVLEFEDSFLHWDDNTSTILYGNEVLPVEKASPLHTSIEAFINGNFAQKQLTLDITRTLQSNDQV
jgi:predicted dehydrogenase